MLARIGAWRISIDETRDARPARCSACRTSRVFVFPRVQGVPTPRGRGHAHEGKGARMGLVELFLIGVGLSMDAFAVAIAKGLGMHRVNYCHALVIALFFGGFQALMPSVGWALGSQFARYVTPVDHWIAFVLLAFIGGKMLLEALRDDGSKEEAPAEERLDIKELFVLAIATSIDALAMGITFAFLDVQIAPAAALIGCTTFVISLAGVVIGNQFGSRWERPSTIAGGVILILIGLHVLLDHLGILSF